MTQTVPLRVLALLESFKESKRSRMQFVDAFRAAQASGSRDDMLWLAQEAHAHASCLSYDVMRLRELAEEIEAQSKR